MEEILRKKIYSQVDENMKYLKELFENNSDFVTRDFFTESKIKVSVCYFDGMADKNLINEFVIKNIMKASEENVKTLDDFYEKVISVSDVSEIESLEDGINKILAGETMLFVDGMEKSYIIATRSFVNRGVATPENEVNIKGAKDAFTEVVRFNTVLVRRRLRDTRLKTEAMSVGERSKTDVVVMYIDDIVNKDVLEKIKTKIKDIKIDAILDSSYVSELLEDKKSLFPLLQSTERPDVVASSLLEGRVAILVDNSPYVLIAPVLLSQLFQSPDDYYQKSAFSTFIRSQRLLALFLAVTAPSFYIAFCSYNGFFIPAKLAYAIAVTREGIPFSSVAEVLIMEIAISMLIESTVRMSKAIGTSISIVGGLVIGQAAVTAGIVSPVMIIVIALTTITTFISPNYDITVGIRLIRLTCIGFTAILGLPGIVIGTLCIWTYLLKLESFGVYYVLPYGTSRSDMQDSFFKASLRTMKKRPTFMKTGDKIRQE